MLSHLKKESMHHAFVIEGDVRHTQPALFDFLKKEFGMDLSHNDLILLDRGDFGIENVQEIVDVNSRKPTVGIHKVIVVVLHSISHQAQNAILKTLEEPRPGTFIFILTNTSAIFLPTILSRVQVVGGANVAVANAEAGLGDSTVKPSPKAASLEPRAFLKGSLADRLSQVKEILDLKSDEEIGDAEIFNFVQEVEKLAHAAGMSSKREAGAAANADIARIFTKVEDYMRDTSSSKKLLLEYVALRLPVF